MTFNKTKFSWKCFVFFLIVFCSALFIFGIPIIINELYKRNEGYVTAWGAADVLAFYAVILSGIITIGALVVTIYYSKKDTEKQIRSAQAQIQVPFFIIKDVWQNEEKINSSNTANGMTWILTGQYSVCPTPVNTITIVLNNVGEGVAVSAIYKSDTLIENGEFLPQNIRKNDDFEIICDLNKVIKNHLDNRKTPSVIITIVVSYQNLVGIKYEQKFDLICKWEEGNVDQIIVNNISAQYASL